MADDDVKKIIEVRAKTHGGYLRNAEITWGIMDLLMSGSRWGDLHPAQKETLHMIAHKMHRIVNGDPMFLDHWVDVEGYTHLIVQNMDEIVRWNLGVQPAVRVGGPARAPAQAALNLAPDRSELSAEGASGGAGIPVPGGGADDLHDPLKAGRRVYSKRYKIRGTLDGSGTTSIGGKVVGVTADDGGAYVFELDDIIFIDEDGEQTEPSDHVNDRVEYQMMHQRQPIRATGKEYMDMKNLVIPAGTLEGHKWCEIYASETDDEGRWIMLNMYHEEYGQ